MSPRTILAAALAAVAVAAPASQARASMLDFQSSSPGPGYSSSAQLASSASNDTWLRERGPLRRRGPRYDGYGPVYRPRSFATLGIGGFDPSNQPGSGIYLNGTVGTELPGSPIDLGAGLSWYHRSTGGSQFVTTYTDPSGNTVRRVIETDEITTDLVPLLGFVRVRFPMGEGMQPYVGAGAGWEWLLVEGVDQDGFAFSDDYSGFGAQFFGGMNFAVSDNTALYGEVLYNASTVHADFFDPTLGMDVRDEIDMDGAGFHAGLRFRF